MRTTSNTYRNTQASPENFYFSSPSTIRTKGELNFLYEKANHLGNVLTVVSDKKIPRFAGDTVNHHQPEILSATDYSAFGAELSGRTFSSSNYRFGFNGQEKDNEVSGNGNTYTATFWEYDVRLARRWNIDPVVKPWSSPYATFSNNPLLFIDPNGNTDFFWKGRWVGTDGKDNGLIAVVNSRSVKREIKAATKAGQATMDYHLCSGDANNKFNVIHVDILKAADAVLDKAISTKSDMLTEHKAVLKENTKGGYDKTYEGSSGTSVVDAQGVSRASGGSTPDGDVRIHSHPVGSSLDPITGVTTSYDATQPSKCDPVVGGDMCKDAEYELNIIVGKTGEAPVAQKNQVGGSWIQQPDNRGNAINVFGSDSKKKFSIARDIVKSILGGEKNKTRKENFKEKQDAVKSKQN